MLNVKKTVTGDEPLTLQEVKDWIKQDGDADDALITSLITQARELIENYLGASLVSTTLVVEATPRTELRPPYGPVVTISSVKDEDGNDVDYVWDGFVLNFTGGTYSVTSGYSPQYTTTTYDTGYDTIPDGLKMALLETVAYLYEHRGEEMKIQMFLYQNQNLQVYRETIWI